MDISERAKKVAERYMEENGETPLLMKPFYDGGIKRGADYRYHADFTALLPEARIGDAAFCECLYFAGEDEVIMLAVKLFSPVELWINGERVYKSDVFAEREMREVRIDAAMKKGENRIKLRFVRTKLGFGGIFGTWLGKWDFCFFRPDCPICEGARYRLNDGAWLPKLKEAEIVLNENEYALFYTKTKDGEDVYVKGEKFPEDKDFVNPFGIEGFGAWVGLYPLKGECEPSFTSTVQGTYWRFKYENVWLRPYYGAGLFGRWSYPLGVTLYGLLRFGELVGDNSIRDYVVEHVKRCTDTFKYALWDKEAHGGAASLHNLLAGIDSLDDCGAFGALVEEAALSAGAEGTEEVCDYISDYIEHRQPRLESGAFCRKNQMHSFHNDTVWADDLYMSVPFLCRRYKITGEEKYLSDAANQFIQYDKLLGIKESGLVSHVLDLRHNAATGIPWGRGNGWGVFSLSEWLSFAPEDFPERAEIEKMFVRRCETLAPLQSEDGRWRQVLDDDEAYLETSCSAMIACAFMRGVRMGLLGEEYAERAKRSVSSIYENCTDDEGNLYGVCRGSEFSFAKEYYKKELLTRKNDTHGIGIILLAAYEVMR
ncbi:MAG: glycoside hydrolase family 88 protein [Clostridia bacterium]|nr:glycoside hydrolase family 88 protein [Clostridia bacterium]